MEESLQFTYFEKGFHWTDPLRFGRLKGYAKRMRMHPTPAESKLWELLQAHRVAGLHFRRQCIIAGYIVDFVCIRKALIIEADGAIHDRPDQATYDAERTKELECLGFTVLRFLNEEILQRAETVRTRIEAAVQNRPDLKLIFPKTGPQKKKQH
ncbi:MAG: endonuclease domain-containing protein [Chitinophagaceae bacterium]|nr:MAG: endonuclease domain-containing protein [Chitinophagaceae bacterium]